MVKLIKPRVLATCSVVLLLVVIMGALTAHRHSLRSGALAAQAAREQSARYYNPLKQEGIEVREKELIKVLHSLPAGFGSEEVRRLIDSSKVPVLIELLQSDVINPSLCLCALAVVDEPQHAFDTTVDYIFTRGQFRDIEVGIDSMMGRVCNVVLLNRFPPAIAGPFLMELLSPHGAFKHLQEWRESARAPAERLHSLEYRLEYLAALALASLGDHASDAALAAFYDRLKCAPDTPESEALVGSYAEVYGMRDMVRALGLEKVIKLDVDAESFLAQLIPYMTKYQSLPTP